MAGGEGSLSRRTAKSLEAASTGPQAQLRSCSTKRKAAKDPASRRMPLPSATTRRKAKEEEAVAAAPGEHKYRLSKAYVNWILAMKPMQPPARLAALKRSNPDLTPLPGEEADEDKCRRYRLARAFFEMQESLPRMQEWMRGELREKGYVEFQGEMAEGRAEVDALIDREWPAIEAKIDALILQDKERQGKGYQGGDESDSGDDESDEEEED